MSEHLGDLVYKLTENANVQRSVYQTNRWQVTRLTDPLVEGKHGKHFAKATATILNEYTQETKAEKPNWPLFYGNVVFDPTASEFDHEKLAVFTSYESDLGKQIKAPILACEKEAEAKYSGLDEHLEANEKWLGTVGHVPDAKLPAEFTGVCKLLHTEAAGGEGWAVACKQNGRRADPNSIPCQGTASLFYAADNQFVVSLCKFKDFLKEGVAPTDFLNWCEKLSGQEFVKEELKTIVLNKGSALYVPAGWWWAVTHMEVDLYIKPDGDSDNEGNGKNPVVLTPDSVGHGLVFSMFVQDWITNMDSGVKASIVGINQAVFNNDKKKRKPMWVARAGIFNAAYGTA